jgi:hypothetical protein
LVFVRQIPFSLVGPNSFLDTFLSNTINLLMMVSFIVRVSHIVLILHRRYHTVLLLEWHIPVTLMICD